jgi:hypothetical protein
MDRIPHQIDLATAKTMITAATAKTPTAPTAWWFDREILDAILAQKDVTGLRIYVGATRDGAMQPILVGTTGEGATGSDLAEGVIGEESWPCPEWCDKSSPLMQS